MSKPRFKIHSLLSLSHLAKDDEQCVDEESEFLKKNIAKGSSFSPTTKPKKFYHPPPKSDLEAEVR
jgi:hypothetical protein